MRDLCGPANASRATLSRATYALALALACVLACAATAEELPDPTRPLDRTSSAVAPPVTESESLPTLNSVVIGPGKALAIIDGRRYRLHETVGSLKIARIERDRVTLMGSGRELTLTLRRQEVKR